MKPLSALLLVLAATCAFAQGAYRWVDKDGKVHYSDSPPEEKAAKKVEQKRLDASVVGGSKLSYEMRQAAENFPVTLYTTPDCNSACKSGRDFLGRSGIPYAEKSIKTAEDVDAYKKAVGAGELSVPTLLVGSKSVKGFEESQWNGMLEAAGYPLKK